MIITSNIEYRIALEIAHILMDVTEFSNEEKHNFLVLVDAIIEYEEKNFS